MRMPRFLSAVTGLAASGLSLGPTQTLRTPLTGARYASCLPSGLRRGDALSGLPKRTLRSMRPVFAPVGVGSGISAQAETAASDAARKARMRVRASDIGSAPCAGVMVVAAQGSFYGAGWWAENGIAPLPAAVFAPPHPPRATPRSGLTSRRSAFRG